MKLKLREMIVFALLGCLMFLSKLLMDALPNIHLLSTLIAVYTTVYRQKALYPIYVFVFLIGLFNGFDLWWLPYLYIWTLLWAGLMLVPKKLKRKYKLPLYMVICCLHGILYGTLYAPVQALIFHFSFSTTVKWIIAGLPFDLIHGIGNLVLSPLIFPLSKSLEYADKHLARR